MTKKILVLGIGSPFADDTAGWLVSDKLAIDERLASAIACGDLVILAENRPGLNLLDYLNQAYDHIILVDMVKTNLQETGNLYTLKAHEIIGFSGMLSSHNLGVSPSLALAEALGIKIEHVLFWGIEGELYKPEESISPAMLTAVDKTSELVAKQIIQLL